MMAVFRHLDLEIFGPKLITIYNVINFRQLEVVGRGSETQLQVGENLNKLTKLHVCEAKIS